MAVSMVALSALVAVQGPSQVLGAGGWRRTRRVAPGVVYTNIKDTRGPFRIHMLSVRLDKPSTLDVVLANDRLPGTERTSSMAARARAIAAVNGDYATPSGRPVYDLARDGDLDHSTEQWGRNFSVDTSETLTYIGHPQTEAWVRDPVTATSGLVDKINPLTVGLDEIGLFSTAGGSESKPPLDACAARLVPGQGPQLRPGGPGVERVFTVEKVDCRYSRMRRSGGVVLATPQFGPRSAEVTSLVPGAQVALGWTLGWTGVFDTIGGNPTLIEDGSIIARNVDGSTAFHRRNPRTGVGTTPDGRVLMVAVDGRRPGFSVGMSLREFANLFRSEGTDWALNLDGGGSTTFVVEGDIKNRPSDGSERPVSSALVLLPGPDPGERFPVRAAASRPPGRGDDAREVITDTGSTGGLTDYLIDEEIPLGPVLRRVHRGFSRSE